MSSGKQLKISPKGKGADLTKDQKRFNRLIERIERARAQLRAWQEAIPLFRQAYVDRILPLQTTLAKAKRQWVLAMDRAMHRKDWSRPDKKTLRQIIAVVVTEMLEAEPDDADLRALFERHGGVDYDTYKQEDLLGMKGLAEIMTGLDLGDDDIKSDDELFQRMEEGMTAQEEAEEAAHEARAHSRAASARQQRQAAEAERVTQSVREIYRKLVSVLHPDREPDPDLRQRKTQMMQKVNQAYADNDLLTLLEAQLQIEQVDTQVQAQVVDTKRLKRYNQVLAEQVQQLDEELEHVEMSFCFDFRLDPGQRLSPKRLGALIEEQTQLLRAAIAGQTIDMRRIADTAAMRRWLKQQRQMMNANPFDEFF